MEPEFYRRQTDTFLEGRSWIIATDVLAGATPIVAQLHELGCRVFVVAGTRGTGPTPDPDHADQFLLGTSGESVMAGIRAFQAAMADPPSELCEVIDAWDPACEAEVLANFLNTNEPVCGRRVFGGAPAAWRALEDKIVAESLWAEAGISHAPSEVVDAQDPAAIVAAGARVGSDEGSVVVGDNRQGWHGGGEYARYLAPNGDHAKSLEFMAANCDAVRVMPFLEGVPSAIHGMVLEDEVLAFRPVEMIVFRRPHRDQFFYAALTTLWDPPVDRRQEMRSAAIRVGALLREKVGYRGAFGVDGVMTADGFMPTELNPRFSGGLAMQAATAGDYPLGDINRLLVENQPLDLRPYELEAAILEGADRTRSARCNSPIRHIQATDTTQLAIGWTGEAWEPTTGDTADATLRLGPAAMGALVWFSLNDGHSLEPGPAFAPTAAKVFALTDTLWDTRIGPLIPGNASYS